MLFIWMFKLILPNDKEEIIINDLVKIWGIIVVENGPFIKSNIELIIA